MEYPFDQTNLGGNMWGGETYCKKGHPAQSAVFLYKKGKVWVTRWSTLFPFYKGKQLIFLSEGARRQSYSAAVERFLSPHISSKHVPRNATKSYHEVHEL